MWTGCLDCCGNISFHWQQFFLCWGLIFFPPAGPSVIYVHYLIFPNSDLSLFLFSAEQYWRVLQLGHRKVCSCMKYVDCCGWLCYLKIITVKPGVICIRHQKGKGWPRVSFHLIPMMNIIFFFFSQPRHTVVDFCSQEIIYCVCINDSKQTTSLVHPNKISLLS